VVDGWVDDISKSLGINVLEGYCTRSDPE